MSNGMNFAWAQVQLGVFREGLYELHASAVHFFFAFACCSSTPSNAHRLPGSRLRLRLLANPHPRPLDMP
jgi:hypothetical protein